MPDPFFASNKSRKRKRAGPSDQGGVRKSGLRANGKATSSKTALTQTQKKTRRDEELSDETSDDGQDIEDMDLRAPDVDPDAYESGEEDEDETPAEKRLRLAKLYLDNVKQGLTLGAWCIFRRHAMLLIIHCLYS